MIDTLLRRRKTKDEEEDENENENENEKEVPFFFLFFSSSLVCRIRSVEKRRDFSVSRKECFIKYININKAHT
jgi:hypothetical protein|tara:strand:+ start:826 stop:1044 length:219 start_codon:yes stop_codon:yes gene_type:complete